MSLIQCPLKMNKFPLLQKVCDGLRGIMSKHWTLIAISDQIFFSDVSYLSIWSTETHLKGPLLSFSNMIVFGALTYRTDRQQSTRSVKSNLIDPFSCFTMQRLFGTALFQVFTRVFLYLKSSLRIAYGSIWNKHSSILNILTQSLIICLFLNSGFCESFSYFGHIVFTYSKQQKDFILYSFKQKQQLYLHRANPLIVLRAIQY